MCACRKVSGGACWAWAVAALTILWSMGAAGARMEWLAVSGDGRGFVRQPSGEVFKVRGFNYDHDRDGTLLEDYWAKSWRTVVSDFREMKALGANTVRVHLQFVRFCPTPETLDEANLKRLKGLVRLAERTGLYLDITGLGCYHKADVPAWYDALDEHGRWEAQARFWEAVARVCQGSPAILCYDLMNEPVVPGGDGPQAVWLGPEWAGSCFVQFITRDRAGRERPDVARAWIERMVKAVRSQDARHLITVGMVDWSLDRPGLTSGFVPEKVMGDLDFLCTHIYPERGKVDAALETLRGFCVGKPVVIEETFSLNCGVDELEQFLTQADGVAAGWIGFYWGQTPRELEKAEGIGPAITLDWLRLFQRLAGTAK